MESIADWIHENPQYSEYQLKTKIHDECRDTFLRKQGLYANDSIERRRFATRKTINKWYAHFVEIIVHDSFAAYIV
jgi:hypothetical protein